VSHRESQPSCISKPWPGFEDAKAEFADANDLVTASIAYIEIALYSMTFKRTSTIKKSMKVVRDILPSILLQLSSCRTPLSIGSEKASEVAILLIDNDLQL
jgi:hypothetical protein